jgi:hypothetical protein
LPTAFYAEVAVDEIYKGAVVRNEPNFSTSIILTGLINGTIVEILDPSPSYDEQGYIWLRIRFLNEDGNYQDGWILESVLLVATPQPDW